jgi:hypothetical protein
MTVSSSEKGMRIRDTAGTIMSAAMADSWMDLQGGSAGAGASSRGILSYRL